MAAIIKRCRIDIVWDGPSNTFSATVRVSDQTPDGIGSLEDAAHGAPMDGRLADRYETGKFNTRFMAIAEAKRWIRTVYGDHGVLIVESPIDD